MDINSKQYAQLTDNEIILFNAIEEITNHLKDDQDNPVSLSLYLWKMGIQDPLAKDKIIQSTFKLIVESDNPLELTEQDFSKEYSQISDLFLESKTSKNMIIYILTWIGLNVSPIAYAISKNIV